MGKYDGILVKKKVYQDPVVHHNRYTKYVLLSLLLLFLLLVGSYWVYYRTVLSFPNLVLRDLKELYEKTLDVVQPVFPEKILSSESFRGEMLLPSDTYVYEGSLDKSNLYVNVKREGDSLYSRIGLSDYAIEFSESEKRNVRSLQKVQWSTVLENLKNYLKTAKSMKNFYFDQHTPIVEVNFTMSGQDLQDIFSSEWFASYQAIVTFQNHAFTNEICSMKLVLTNTKNRHRYALLYQKDEITYTAPDGQKYLGIIKKNGEDFSMRIYRDDSFYSIFLKKKEKDQYVYTYQILDRVYNITFSVSEGNGNYSYQVLSDIEHDGETREVLVKLNLQKQEKGLLEESSLTEVDYTQLKKEEQESYQKSLDLFLKPFKELLQEYKTNV